MATRQAVYDFCVTTFPVTFPPGTPNPGDLKVMNSAGWTAVNVAIEADAFTQGEADDFESMVRGSRYYNRAAGQRQRFDEDGVAVADALDRVDQRKIARDSGERLTGDARSNFYRYPDVILGSAA